MDQDVIRHGARRRPRRLCVRWGSSTPKKDTDSEFSARVYCGQTAVCISKLIPLGTEVGLSPRDIVLDGDPAPVKGHSPQFSANVRCGQTAGWTKMPLGMEVGLGPGDFLFDGDPAPPEKKGCTLQPHFWPMSIVATVSRLSYY